MKRHIMSRVYMVLAVLGLGLLGTNAYTNYQLAKAQEKQAEALREFVIMKPFPILCRNQVRY